MASWWVNTAIAVELCVSIAVVLFATYREIDWMAYMQEVNGFLNGELNYAKLEGGTGPLVYPGGFVWSYSALYYVTKGGSDILMAQWVYLGMYVMILAAVLTLYDRSRIPRRFWLRLFLSKRIRSIFLLRLFNDSWAMLLMYIAILSFANGRRWKFGCLLYSVAVSVKMNVLLFFPGLMVILCKMMSWPRVVSCLAVFALWQVVVGLPFLLHHPQAYLLRAFDVQRVFTHKWSINFKCIPEEFFVSREFAHALLLLTLLSWLLIWRRRWSKRSFGRTHVATLASTENKKNLEISVFNWNDEAYRNIVLTLMESNMIGVIFARSLHYQFFSWFFHSIPMVLSETRLPFVLQLATMAAVQYGFEVYPSTTESSLVLLSGFAIMWFSLVFLGEEGGASAPSLEEKRGSNGCSPPRDVVSTGVKGIRSGI